MDYQEAADRLEAFSICTEAVPVGCEQCPAYQEGEDREKQQQACNSFNALLSLSGSAAYFSFLFSVYILYPFGYFVNGLSGNTFIFAQ